MENTTANAIDELLVLEVSSEEEARRQAAERWGVTADQVVTKVIEESKSFFGLFGSKVKVEVRRLSPVESGCSEPAQESNDSAFLTLLEKVISAAGLDLQCNVQSDGSINLSGPDSRYLLDRRHGEGLKALDYIVNLMARNDGPVPHVRLDCDGFRRKREKDLERIAMDAAKEAMKTRRTVYLPPMSSWERRIVHLTLRESTNVETHSIGVEPGRKVAVRLLGAGSRREGAPSRRREPSRERSASAPSRERSAEMSRDRSSAPRRPRSGRPPRRNRGGEAPGTPKGE